MVIVRTADATLVIPKRARRGGPAHRAGARARGLAAEVPLIRSRVVYRARRRRGTGAALAAWRRSSRGAPAACRVWRRLAPAVGGAGRARPGDTLRGPLQRLGRRPTQSAGARGPRSRPCIPGAPASRRPRPGFRSSCSVPVARGGGAARSPRAAPARAADHVEFRALLPGAGGGLPDAGSGAESARPDRPRGYPLGPDRGNAHCGHGGAGGDSCSGLCGLTCKVKSGNCFGPGVSS